MLRRLILIAFFATFARSSLAEVTIRLVISEDTRKSCVIVEGISEQSLQDLKRLPSEELSMLLQLFVDELDLQETTPPVLGDCYLEQEQIVFQPRFDLLPGKKYRAEFRTSLRAPISLRKVLSIPAKLPALSSKVEAIYPSASELPQNLLRIYLHFSIPMQQGDVYQYISLHQEVGSRIELPFLELAEELWDRSGTRLTLLLDPGRVKRGLVPREQEGAILEKGKRYRLKIDSRWPNIYGIPLGSDSIKEFTVSDEDFLQPNPLEWKVIPPVLETHDVVRATPSDLRAKDLVSSSLQPLQIDFPSALDHALVERCIQVVDFTGKVVSGTVSVANQERRWIFLPNTPWIRGRYTLQVDSILEDVAGNSIARPFEVDLRQKPQEPIKSESLHFEIQ